jgi:hypothetical protein
MKDSLIRNLKLVLVSLATVLVLLAGYAAFIYVYHTLPPTQVEITVGYSPQTTCRADAPVYMLIKNDSLREIVSTSFNLSIQKENENYNYLPMSARVYSTDRVISAGETYGGCWPFPKLESKKHVPEKLIYKVTGQNLVFRD